MTNKKLYIAALVIFLAGVYYTPTQAATTYYVAINGNDQNFGTQTSPYRTIQKCVNMASIGDLCSIGAGTYNERFNINKPVTVSCIVKHACVIQGATLGSGAVIDGFHSLNNPLNDGGIVGNGSGYKIISNKVEGSCMVGIKLNGSNGLAENNEILKSRQCSGSSGPDADGIRYFGAGQVMRGNYIHDISQIINPTAHVDCFQTWGGASGAIIENNICDNPTINGTLAGSGANIENDTGAIFRNNYWRISGKMIMVESSSSGTIIENNIFVGGPKNTPPPYQYGLFGNGSGEVARNNIFWQVVSQNNTPLLLGVSNGGGNILNSSNPNMSGYCSASYPKIGVLCAGSPPPTNTPTVTPSASPGPSVSPTRTLQPPTRTPVLPSVTPILTPTLAPAPVCYPVSVGGELIGAFCP